MRISDNTIGKLSSQHTFWNNQILFHLRLLIGTLLRAANKEVNAVVHQAQSLHTHHLWVQEVQCFQDCEPLAIVHWYANK